MKIVVLEYAEFTKPHFEISVEVMYGDADGYRTFTSTLDEAIQDDEKAVWIFSEATGMFRDLFFENEGDLEGTLNDIYEMNSEDMSEEEIKKEFPYGFLSYQELNDIIRPYFIEMDYIYMEHEQMGGGQIEGIEIKHVDRGGVKSNISFEK